MKDRRNDILSKLKTSPKQGQTKDKTRTGKWKEEAIHSFARANPLLDMGQQGNKRGEQYKYTAGNYWP